MFTTMKAFLGGLTDHPHWPIIGTHVPPYMEKANLDFLREAMGIEYEERQIKNVDIDPDTVKSGDFLGIMRLDGAGSLIMYGTGSRVGHNVMALRFDGVLYIVESTDGPGYANGIQRTPWAKWMKDANQFDYLVTYHRLNDEARAKFDEKKA